MNLAEVEEATLQELSAENEIKDYIVNLFRAKLILDENKNLKPFIYQESIDVSTPREVL